MSGEVTLKRDRRKLARGDCPRNDPTHTWHYRDGVELSQVNELMSVFRRGISEEEIVRAFAGVRSLGSLDHRITLRILNALSNHPEGLKRTPLQLCSRINYSKSERYFPRLTQLGIISAFEDKSGVPCLKLNLRGSIVRSILLATSSDEWDCRAIQRYFYFPPSSGGRGKEARPMWKSDDRQ
jgi:hypothetical protein